MFRLTTHHRRGGKPQDLASPLMKVLTFFKDRVEIQGGWCSWRAYSLLSERAAGAVAQVGRFQVVIRLPPSTFEPLAVKG